MKSRLRLLLLALFMIAFGSQGLAADRVGWVQYETDIPYAKMIKRLNAAVKAEKMLLVSRASASSGAKRRKIKIQGNMVVGVYRNDYALRMLDASVEAGIEAPIRFYITERSGGGSTLSYKTPVTTQLPYFCCH
ncbi:MAG: DUF302 domain-containing protein [Rhizobiaceae bacterium]|nr:DUF302 domain-containing protein [Rhizobiaceae bacterium]